jgi:hypothetical protein
MLLYLQRYRTLRFCVGVVSLKDCGLICVFEWAHHRGGRNCDKEGREGDFRRNAQTLKQDQKAALQQPYGP